MNLEWSDLQLIDAIHRGGSVREAGELLGTHASTITRRLERLERSLGVKLFSRTPSGLKLTSAGAKANTHVARIAGEVAQLSRRIGGDESVLAGSLDFALPEILGPVVVELVAMFAADAPDIDIVFVAEHRRLDLGARDADLGLMITDAPPEHLLGRSLLNLTMAAYASAEYIEQTDAEAYGWLGWDAPETDGGGMRDDVAGNVRVTHSTTSPSLYFDMLLQGLGMGLLPDAVADRLGLVRVPTLSSVAGPAVWLLWHPDLRHNARVRALSGFLAESFAKIGTPAVAGD